MEQLVKNPMVAVYAIAFVIALVAAVELFLGGRRRG